MDQHGRHWLIVWGVTLVSAAVGWGAELPSEAMLPGVKIETPQLFPPESALPNQPGQITESPSDVPLLPSESVLPSQLADNQKPPIPPPPNPGVDPGPEPPPPGGDDGKLPAIGKRPEDRPWLRLNMRGHTSTIRDLVFTRDGAICSAGEDKSVEVWAPIAQEMQRSGWINERTIRWQVQRGPRGRIYALASTSGLLALGGHGAMGGLGEILLVDPLSGDLKRALVDSEQGHRQVIAGLAFAPRDGAPVLASTDVQGQAMLWRQDAESGLWSSTQLSPPDRQRYGEAVAERLVPSRRYVPIVFAGPRYVVSAAYDGQRQHSSVPGGINQWSLERVNIDTGAKDKLPSQYPHFQMVTALAASRDGSKLASADTAGYLYLWDLSRGPQATRLQQQAAVISLAFSQDGSRLLAGAARSPKLDGSAQIQIWDVSRIGNPQRITQKTVAEDVHAVGIAPDGSRFAYNQANTLIVGDLANPQRKAVGLRADVGPVRFVAFARQRPYHRVAIGTSRNADGSPNYEQTFDLKGVQLGQAAKINSQEWIPAGWWGGDWSLRPEKQGARETYWLYEGEVRRAQVPLRTEIHGAPLTRCWIPDRDGNPYAIAVGTDGRNNIYVFQLAQEGTAPLLRQFRGHAAAVRSLGVSRDLAYLVSGSDDATVRVWNLQELARENTLGNRWGAYFEVRDGRLVASVVREDGPLFFRGMRTEDVVTVLHWHDGTDAQRLEDPGRMLETLRTVAWDRLIGFEYQRRDLKQPSFQMFPAWQPLASLFVSQNRQWAFWTPAGYYDASFDGHKLFGWQVNHGLTVLPEFFLAAQLRRSLERPRVMQRLLETGSLEGAFRNAGRQPPVNPQNVVTDEYRLKPRVKILSPQPGAQVAGASVPVEAAVTVRNGLRLVPPKVFANGVVGGQRELVSQRAVPGGQEYRYRWNARLPSEPRILLQVVAATEAETGDTQSVTIERTGLASKAQRRMYVVASGINDYRDAQIQRLEYAVNNARSLVDVLRRGSAPLYLSDATMLLNQRATRSLWNVVTRDYAERLKDEVTPDDLLVFFLSGHGLRDERTQNYYYVGANAKYSDLRSDRYADCMSFEDFAAFSDVPCRKLMILDTCHSGAIQQPLRQQDLKAALRSLQNDVVFTLTASEGSQEAVEEKDRKMGRFTSRLVEALEGIADSSAHGGDEDGIVTLNETIQYVQRQVVADSEGDPDGLQQYPTAGPVDLLEYVSLPLTANPIVATGE